MRDFMDITVGSQRLVDRPELILQICWSWPNPPHQVELVKSIPRLLVIVPRIPMTSRRDFSKRSAEDDGGGGRDATHRTIELAVA